MIYLHELTPLDRDKRVLTGGLAELADLALAADRRGVGAAWSPLEVDVVLDAAEGDDAEVLDRIFVAWYEAVPSLGGVDYWLTASDPDSWDWALPSAETLARRLLGDRHQCAGNPAPCCCDLRGVMFPRDAASKREAGHLLRPL